MVRVRVEIGVLFGSDLVNMVGRVQSRIVFCSLILHTNSFDFLKVEILEWDGKNFVRDELES